MMRFVDDLHLRQLASRFRAWIHFEKSNEIIADLGALTDEELSRFTTLYADCVTKSAIQTVIDRSYATLGRNPPDAVRLARLAIRLAERSWSTNQDRDEMMLGDAWRQYAGAL